MLRSSSSFATISAVIAAIALVPLSRPALVAAQPDADRLQQQFQQTVQPLLKTHCYDCHGAELQEAELNLAEYSSLAAIAKGFQTWEVVQQRLAAEEMPPGDAPTPLSAADRQTIVAWIRAVRDYESQRTAGDPGEVLARRLSNAEYNYTIRDLTGVDIRPTSEFPVDPANEAGFDNTGESLAMSPALLQKYLGAARQVVEHLVLLPEGFTFAPHPVQTNTDRDKFCVARIIAFYQRQPTDYADYFQAAWRYQHRGQLDDPATDISQIAAAEGVSPEYLELIWRTVAQSPAEVGPIAALQSMWRALPPPAENEPDIARAGCEKMRDYVVALRKKLEPHFDNLEVEGIHKGSQPFVLWKNRQYAAHRRKCNLDALQWIDDGQNANGRSDQRKNDTIDPDLAIPSDPRQRAKYEAAFERFCSVFPDAFVVSERGRDYLGKPKDEQEKGRLLSAGFHSMMGYFRDDGPLYDLILDERGQQELDRLWRELDFITSAPMRQHQNFVWFERTDSRFMRDPEFDFARAEDKDVTSEEKITRLAQVYLAKAKQNGGQPTAMEALEYHFRDINAKVRWVEQARLQAEPSHLDSLVDFAGRAFRRPLSSAEKEELIEFYQALRQRDGLTHEEAIQDAVVSVLMSPHFCYRMDLVEAGAGVRPLSDYELASRLSFFLWSSMPDEELLANAEAGELRDQNRLLAQTRRMLRDERVGGLAVEFGGHWLDFRRFEEHNSVDRQRFKSFTDELRSAMFQEPVRFFVDLAQADRSVLDFLYADYTFANRVLAEHYGLPGFDTEENDAWRRVDNAGDYGRGGLLPMSVFLTKNAPGLRTSPVKRGYWVVRRLLGERIPPPPPNVPELPNDESKLGELTLRQTLALHREHKNCAACHERFDSIGLVFEGYGPIGERRERDLGGRDVETGAVFPGGSEGVGIEGLKDYLRDEREEEFLDNLCRKLLSYALGRSLILSDEQTVVAMRENLAKSDYRFSALVESIVASPQFLTKRGGGNLTIQ